MSSRECVGAGTPQPDQPDFDPGRRQNGADNKSRRAELDLRDIERGIEVSNLFEANYLMLLRFATLLGAENDAEDIVAEAFCELYKRWSGLRDHDSALSYLRSVISNQVRMRIRHLRVIRRHIPWPEPDAASAESEVVVKEDRREVSEALSRLPMRQREVLVHRYWLGCTEVEVAKALGISVGSVKVHKSRAISSLEKTLDALR